MSVYASRRNQSKTQYIDNARKLAAHSLTYCLKAPKRLTFFLTKDICDLAKKTYYYANAANQVKILTREDANLKRKFLQMALSSCSNMEMPLVLLNSRLGMNPEEAKKWNGYAFTEWGRLISEEQKLIIGVMRSDLKTYSEFYKVKIEENDLNEINETDKVNEEDKKDKEDKTENKEQ